MRHALRRKHLGPAFRLGRYNVWGKASRDPARLLRQAEDSGEKAGHRAAHGDSIGAVLEIEIGTARVCL